MKQLDFLAVFACFAALLALYRAAADDITFEEFSGLWGGSLFAAGWFVRSLFGIVVEATIDDERNK